MEIKIVWIGLLIIAVLAALFPIFLGRFYAVGDTRNVFIPLELFFQKEIRAGQLPAWMPQAAWGFPVIAAAQIGFFYPPLFISRLILPIQVYLPLMLVGHLIALAIGTYMFARALKLSPAASYLAAISFTLGQFVMQHMTHLNMILAITWFPWQMLFAYLVANRKKLLWRDVAGFILLLGIPFLAGQLQMQFLMAVVTVIWFAYLRLTDYEGEMARRARGVLVIILLTALGTFAIASVQLLPTLELVHQSSRGSDGDFNIVRANQFSFPLYHLPTVLFPRFYSNDDTYWGKRLEIEYGIFIGTIPFLLAMLAFTQPHPDPLLSKERGEMKFLKWLLIITFLLALGSLSPFRLLGLEPTMWIFSGPARWLLFTTFAAALLAGFGWDHALQSKNTRRFVGIVTAILAIGIVAANIWLFKFDVAGFFPPEAGTKITHMQVSAQMSSVSLRSSFTYVPIISLTAWLMFASRRNGYKILLAVITIELFIFAVGTTPTVSWKSVLALPDSIKLLPADVRAGDARIISVQEGGDTGAYFTNPQSRVTAAGRQEQQQLLLPLMSAQYGLGGVEWPASLDLRSAAAVLEHLQHNLKLAATLNIGAILTSANGNIRLETVAAQPRLTLAGGSVISLMRTDTSERVQVDSPQGGQLLIKETWYPGWNAVVDGRVVTIDQVQGLFRGINVPPGRHVVETNYGPRLLYVGMVISGLALVLCLSALYTKSNV